VTHDIEEALRLATVIAILDKGRLAQLGTPLDIVENPESDFVRGFVGAQGIGLKLLSVRRVGERMRVGENADGAPIALDATLAEALGAMTERHRDRLPVADGEGRVVGVIALADLVR
jgi:osmoprotectant transport system ATP-binding protein